MEHHNIQHGSPLMMLLSFGLSIVLIIHAKLVVMYSAFAHIPPIIIESLQCLSYAGSFGIFVLTVYKLIKEKRKKK